MSVRPNLVALPGYADRPEPDVLFCAHCGSHAPDGATPLTRVCGDCGLGLLVGAAPSLAPQPARPSCSSTASSRSARCPARPSRSSA